MLNVSFEVSVEVVVSPTTGWKDVGGQQFAVRGKRIGHSTRIAPLLRNVASSRLRISVRARLRFHEDWNRNVGHEHNEKETKRT